MIAWFLRHYGEQTGLLFLPDKRGPLARPAAGDWRHTSACGQSTERAQSLAELKARAGAQWMTPTSHPWLM
jgi:hypothetical protein